MYRLPCSPGLVGGQFSSQCPDAPSGVTAKRVIASKARWRARDCARNSTRVLSSRLFTRWRARDCARNSTTVFVFAIVQLIRRLLLPLHSHLNIRAHNFAIR